MQTWFETVNGKFPIRNGKEEKAAFRAWVLKNFPSAREETSEKHTNLIFGDPAQAKVIFCAHYDTPRRSLFPNLMLPVNKILHWLYTFGVLIPLLALAFGFGRVIGMMGTEQSERYLVAFGFLIVYYSLYFLLFRGPANKHNANDNTSGVGTVLELADRLRDSNRCAMILFDDEEKGKQGSKAYAKVHPEIRGQTPVINLDCVGNGTQTVVCVSDAFVNHALYRSFRACMEGCALPAQLYEGGRASMNSDHRSFTVSAGICACRVSRRGIRYTPFIHTGRDTVAEPGNILALAEALEKLAQ